MKLTLAKAAFALIILAACGGGTPPTPEPLPAPQPPDARVSLRGGLTNAEEAASNLRLLSRVPSPPGFQGTWNSDLAFSGNYAIQGNFNGIVIWDITNPSAPKLVASHSCPASQNDVSVFRNLLFVSVESNGSRLDCTDGLTDSVSALRIRGVRIFDITDVRQPRLVANVQTCRGSHTHTVVEDPADRENVYVYVSGSAQVRSPAELPACVTEAPDRNPNSALMRVEIIKVPIANPERAQVVNRANIFADLRTPRSHGLAHDDSLALARARASGAFMATDPTSGEDFVVGSAFVQSSLDSIVKSRGGSGAPTAADSAALRAGMRDIINRIFAPDTTLVVPGSPNSPYRQCHDITVYTARRLAGGACEGHGFLIDISDPVNPVRLDAVVDSNFAYWHSATFNNDGTKILFSDEWGGGTGPRCRATDRKEWGANAIFEIENRRMRFRSYYKLPVVQTKNENCVAHNGSLIPIPGRDVMVQGWYQGGVSIFDWTDAAHPREIAYFDRGPVDSTRLVTGGSWSAYWYNGAIVSSEMARGLDVAELVPSEHISQNEIDAAKTVRWSYLNAQSQPQIAWPPSFSLAKAYVDQLERSKCMSAEKIAATRQSISQSERATGPQRATALAQLSTQFALDAASCDKPKVALLQKAFRDLGNVIVP